MRCRLNSPIALTRQYWRTGERLQEKLLTKEGLQRRVMESGYRRQASPNGNFFYVASCNTAWLFQRNWIPVGSSKKGQLRQVNKHRESPVHGLHMSPLYSCRL